MAQKRRPANDRAFKKYKINNQRYKNKIAKMIRHIKKHPNDKTAKENLKRVESNPIKDKIVAKDKNSVRPLPISIPSFRNSEKQKTAGEQLSKLLGIPMLKIRKRSKAKISTKRRKNVKS